MFTLCMSREHPPLQEPPHNPNRNNVTNKQIKGGYLLRYRRGFFCKGWSEEWVVLYEDSTLAWYADKGLSRPRGHIRISEAPELLAVGEWTRQVPRRPRFPSQCHVGQLLAIGSRTFHEVHWLMAQSPAEINDWMTAISNTLPPPPHMPLDDKRLSLTPHHLQNHTYQEIKPVNRSRVANGCAVPVRNGNAGGIRHASSNMSNGNSAAVVATAATAATAASTVAASYNNLKNNGHANHGQAQAYDADHTVLSGVVIDWGHGWGWGQAAWAAQTACAHEAAVASAIYCHAADDYALGGYDEVDWSTFGDFSF